MLQLIMCYKFVNETDVEVCLALAHLYDQGFPTIPHVHDCITPTPSPESTEESEEDTQSKAKDN